MSLVDAVATAPRRRLTGNWWHQGPTRHPLTSCADPAQGPGRYTNPAVREHLDIDENDLLTDDYTITQELGAAARDAGFEAVLAPAAALPGRQTLAVFASSLPKVQAERSEIRQPPPRLADLLPLIRPYERVPDAIR